MTQTALDIYQAYLDVSTRLVIDGEAEAYCDHVQLPFVFRTGAGVEVVETRADLAFDIMRAHDWMKQKSVSDYHRIAREAQFLDEETIEGFHVTYALRGAVPVLEPYSSRAILRRTGDSWRVSFAEHELRDALYPDRDARAQHGIFAPRWTRGPAGLTRDPMQALPIYRATVERIARLASCSDPEAWYACYTQPFTVHYDTGDEVVETADQNRKFYDLLHQSMAKAGADTLSIRATSAIFLSESRLLGYHEARFTKNGESLFGPIQSRMVLVEMDGTWLCNSIANALSTSAYVNGAFEPSDTFPTIREIEKRMKP